MSHAGQCPAAKATGRHAWVPAGFTGGGQAQERCPACSAMCTRDRDGSLLSYDNSPSHLHASGVRKLAAPEKKSDRKRRDGALKAA